ncbi:MAG: hypothetical protein AAGF10_02755 [Verrucomicrobiota bacterium]
MRRLIITLSLFFSAVLQADTIAMRSGSVYEGKYLETTDNGQTVVFEANGKRYSVPHREVQGIMIERDGKSTPLPGFGPMQPPKWKYVPPGDYYGGNVPGNYVRQSAHPHRYRQNRYRNPQQQPSNQPHFGQPAGPAPMDIDGPMGKPAGPAPMDINQGDYEYE